MPSLGRVAAAVGLLNLHKRPSTKTVPAFGGFIPLRTQSTDLASALTCWGFLISPTNRPPIWPRRLAYVFAGLRENTLRQNVSRAPEVDRRSSGTLLLDPVMAEPPLERACIVSRNAGIALGPTFHHSSTSAQSHTTNSAPTGFRGPGAAKCQTPSSQIVVDMMGINDLSRGPLSGLGEGQKPECASGEARGGGGLGQIKPCGGHIKIGRDKKLISKSRSAIRQ